MSSPTTVLAEREPLHEELVLMALKRVVSDPRLVVVHDGEAVIDLFLHKQKKLVAKRGESHVNCSGTFLGLQECDLLLVNLALPKLDGLKVLRQLRWLHRDDLSTLPPVVMLSDSCDDALVTAAYRFGASGFLCKAETTPRFDDALQQTIRYWLGSTMRPASHTSQCRSKPASRDTSFPFTLELAPS